MRVGAGAPETFEEHRPLLFGIAYRMLGSVADAEDILQDAWLRWHDVTGPVRNPRAYLARTVTNLSINRLSSVSAQREAYVGPWLPEPLVTAAAVEADVAEDVERAEAVSMAMLVVMESLSPLERAVFVLKEVFGFSYAEVARTLERGEAAVRQVGHRARSHIQARRPRFDPPTETWQRVTEEFMQACLGGDINRMMELMAPDVTAWSDGGGKIRSALRPIHGPDKVARWLLAVKQYQERVGVSMRLCEVNGQPGILVVHPDGTVDSAGTMDLVGGRIAALWVVRNPDKLRGIAPD